MKRNFRLSRAAIKDLDRLEYEKLPMFLKRPTVNKKIKIAAHEETGKLRYVANENVKKGAVLFNNNNARTNRPLRNSLQINKKRHMIMPTNYLLHSCTYTNCHINTKNQIVASVDIKEGKEIVFNYLTTQYNLKNPALCECNSKDCVKEFKGFKHLTQQQKEKLIEKGNLSNYINYRLHGKVIKQNIEE